jgi:hypothetical protein
MPSDSVQQFLDQAERSGLFTSPEASEAIAQLTADLGITPDALSAQLVEKKLLTPTTPAKAS